MKTVIAFLAFANLAAADEPPLVTPPMVCHVARVVIPAPEPAPIAANIFADYPDAKLRAALQPPVPQPVARAVRPNFGNCPCGQGRCICSPASICPNGCPAVVNLRKDDVKYYFPAFDPNCPTGR